MNFWGDFVNVVGPRSVSRLMKASGFMLIEVITAVLVAGLLVAGITTAAGQFSKQQSNIMARLTTLNLSLNLRRTLMNDSALMNTMFHGGNSENDIFDCLRPANLNPLAAENTPTINADCKNKTGTLDKLISSSGEILADLSDSSAGFTSSGDPCTGYGTNPLCTVKVKIDVRYECAKNDPTCTQV